MAKNKNILAKTMGFVVWLTGIIVSLAVAFGMIDGVLTIKWIPQGVLAFFGYIVVLTTLIGVILAIVNEFN